jgi:uncharacterized protein (DUF427 family)
LATTQAEETTVKAIWNGTVIADSEQTVEIEGNQYFPPESIKEEYLEKSDHHSFCNWKGDCSYYDVVVDGNRNENAAWYYPQPMTGSIPKVGHDYSNYVAFWHGVKVES